MEGETVVTGVLNDIHHLGLVIVGGALTEAGFNVVYLGTHLGQDDFISAAIETGAAAIFVSQSCGHALIDAQGFRQRCQEAGIGDILLYLGGSNLVIDPAGEWTEADVENRFKAMGFSRVYGPDVQVTQIVRDLRDDLAASVNRAEV